MDTKALNAQLAKVGDDLVRWRAELKFTWCLAIVLGLVFLFALADLWLRLGRSDRFITWGIVVAVASFGVWLARRALRKRYTAEAVAASIEETFPQLDNRLINYLQLARNPEGDPFKAAYVRDGGPRWRDLNLAEMRDADAHRRSRMTLGIVAVVLLLPALFVGEAWGWRCCGR